MKNCSRDALQEEAPHDSRRLQAAAATATNCSVSQAAASSNATCTSWRHSAIAGVKIALLLCLLLAILPQILILYLLSLLFPPKLFAKVIHSLFESIYTDHEKCIDSDTGMTEIENSLNCELNRLVSDKKKHFDFLFCLPYILKGNQDIIDDDVTKHFSSSQIEKWNILTRNYNLSLSMSCKVKVKYMICFIVRYVIMLPVRVVYVCSALYWLFLTALITVMLPSGQFRTQFYEITFSLGVNLALCSFSYVEFHNEEFKPQKGSICVTNHTSPIDALVLSRNQVYSLTGKKFDDIIAYFQQMLSSCANHIWFEREKAEQRHYVVEAMRLHCLDGKNYPILIFPEGTCINNKAVMMFNKGAFEVPNVVIYPAVMKYNHLFADPFWNSSRYSLSHFVLRLMTSWSLFCDVYYLPPQTKKDDETSIEFAARVKRMIAEKGGMVDLDWNGNLKRTHPKKAKVDEAKKNLTMKLISDSLIVSNHEQ